jgi:hypothetical protein
MNLAQLLEVKGDVTLESAQVYPGGMSGPTSFPHMGGHIGGHTGGHMGGHTGGHIGVHTGGHMGGHMPFVQPSVAPFGGSGFTPGFGIPSVPSVVPVPSFPVGH